MELAVLMLLALFSWSHGSKQPDFKQWSSVYLPDATQNELDAIYPTWKKNAELVSAHNQQNSQFTMTLNKFAHLTPDRISKIPPLLFESNWETRSQNILTESVSLPKSFDWRDQNVITPVHNQEGMDWQGCSKALVLSDAVSSLNASLSHNLYQFSSRQLFDCCWHCNCSAGIVSYDCLTLINLCTSALYPSQPDSECQCLDAPACDFYVKGVKSVSTGKERALASAVLASPVLAVIDASHSSFQLYKSGIYSEPNCSSTQLNHVILVVGFGEKHGKKYWICKNSWGVDWGMEGYFLLARDRKNMCGIATQALYLYV